MFELEIICDDCGDCIRVDYSQLEPGVEVFHAKDDARGEGWLFLDGDENTFRALCPPCSGKSNWPGGGREGEPDPERKEPGE